MKIFIDARGLNYLKQTGVNIYTLNVINQIIKVVGTSDQIVLVGIKKEFLSELTKRYPWLFSHVQVMELYEYLGIPRVIKSLVPSRLVGLMLEILGIVLPRMVYDRVFFRLKFADILWQPQPKSLPVHKKTRQYVVTAHDLFGLKNREGLLLGQVVRENKLSLKKIFNRSDKILAVSYSTGDDVAALFKRNREKIRVVYSGLPQSDLLYYSEDDGFKEISINSNYWVAISGIEPRKNWHNIILAHHYNQLHRKDEYSMELVLAGIPVNEKYYKYLKELVAENNISGVTFIESITESNKKILINGSKAVIYTSLYEGFGFPILESMEQGKPVITSEISSMPEIARDSGLYVNPLDIVDIANGMMVALKDTALFDKLEKNIPKNKKEFNWSENKKVWVDLLTISGA